MNARIVQAQKKDGVPEQVHHLFVQIIFEQLRIATMAARRRSILVTKRRKMFHFSTRLATSFMGASLH